MLAWDGGLFDPDGVGEAKIAAALTKLAQRQALGGTAFLIFMDR
jgi:hypothetical protein